MRRDDDHKLRLAAAEVTAAKQGAKDRQITEPWNLRFTIREIFLQQTGDGKALAVPQLNVVRARLVVKPLSVMPAAWT